MPALPETREIPIHQCVSGPANIVQSYGNRQSCQNIAESRERELSGRGIVGQSCGQCQSFFGKSLIHDSESDPVAKLRLQDLPERAEHVEPPVRHTGAARSLAHTAVFRSLRRPFLGAAEDVAAPRRASAAAADAGKLQAVNGGADVASRRRSDGGDLAGGGGPWHAGVSHRPYRVNFRLMVLPPYIR